MKIPQYTPAKKEFIIDSAELNAAIAAEWNNAYKFSSSAMPLTALAFTAIDRIEPQKAAIIEALLVYADTDTLCYRAPEEELKTLQNAKWNIILSWASLRLGSKWQVVEGIMPLDQPENIHKALREYFEKQSSFALAAICVLAGGFSSLILAIAVCEKHLSAADAFNLSRLEEEYNIAKWGSDEEVKTRTERLRKEMLSAGEFLNLL